MKSVDLLNRKTPLAILVVEDDDGDFGLIEEMLSRPDAYLSAGLPVNIVRAKRLQECVPLLFSGIDVVILDLTLPDSRGLETLKAVRQEAPEVPVVVLSGLDDESVALEAVRQGAQDYLAKSQVGLKMLFRVIRYAIERTNAERQMLKIHSLETEMAERLRAEDLLRKSERQLAKAQRIANVGSWEWDIPANHVTWSGEMYRIFGLRESEFDGTYEASLKHVHPEDRDRLHAAVARSYDDGQPFDLHHRIIRPDGSVRHLHARGEPVLDDDAHVVRMLGTSQDVTDITLAIESARQQNALIGLLQKVSASANQTANVADALDTCLPEIRRLTGWEIAAARVFESGSEPAAGFVSYEAPFHADHPFLRGLRGSEAISSLALRVMSSAKPQWSFDLRDENFPGKDEALADGFTAAFGFPILVRSSAVGVIEYYTRSAMEPSGTLIDVMAQIGIEIGRVVERTVMESDRRRAQVELEKRVQERTRELSRINAELKRSNAELEQFAFIASHDLTEPLRRISAFGDLLKSRARDWNDDRSFDYVVRMQESAQRMSKLIENLLRYSRVAPAAVPPPEFPLAEAVREAAEAARPALAGVEVAIGDLPIVKADRAQMRELFEHLFDNAAKFRSSRPLRIDVDAQPLDGTFAVAVRDNGIGI
ncbi:MAG: PAS domain-containing protein, partial [Elusimicrobia bacterium]|nr:PAS domain-containing protein [Elusimicrobiota bacterium]